MIQEKVLVTGASGFIGQRLVKFLLDRDFQVIALTRQANRVAKHPNMKWIQHFDEIQTHQIDYVVNLAGESIGDGRWTDARKKQLIQSRVETTQQLYRYLQKNKMKPKRIISGSAIGFYGIDPSEFWAKSCNEHSEPQAIFMSELCQQWEQEALKDAEQDTRIIRLGIVFGQGGGILPKMLLPIKLNLIGKIGSGKQPITWVHIDDVIQAIYFLFKTTSTDKIYNVVAPDHISQAEFANITALTLKRKPFLSLPAWVMRLMMGEQSQLVLNGQYVKPNALMEAGFKFKYSDYKLALKNIMGE